MDGVEVPDHLKPALGVSQSACGGAERGQRAGAGAGLVRGWCGAGAGRVQGRSPSQARQGRLRGRRGD